MPKDREKRDRPDWKTFMEMNKRGCLRRLAADKAREKEVESKEPAMKVER
ncbi:MAG: hypothetical protein ACOY9Y_02245 [Bacillota bacterium]